MSKLFGAIKRFLLILICVGVIAGGTILGIFAGQHPSKDKPNNSSQPLGNVLEYRPENPPIMIIPASLFEEKRFEWSEAKGNPVPEPLHLSGSLMANPNGLTRVRSLFNGNVVKIATLGQPGENNLATSIPNRSVRPGDLVAKGQVLAVIWSKDVGNMKTKVIDARSQLLLDQMILERYLNVEKGTLPENTIETAKRAVSQDDIALKDAKRGLRSYQFSESDIEFLEKQADALAKIKLENGKLVLDKSNHDVEIDRHWADYEIRAPESGVLIEKNINIGDAIDPSMVLFQIADLTEMQVQVNAQEEDITKLQKLPTYLRRWQVSIDADAEQEPISGTFEKFGSIIDPMQHTGSIFGMIPNPNRSLIIGQFVRVDIPLPPESNWVSIPTSAVVEEEDGTIVYVQKANQPGAFTRRKISIAVRGRRLMYVLMNPNASMRQIGIEGLSPGEKVLSKGAIQLAAEWKDLQKRSKK